MVLVAPLRGESTVLNTLQYITIPSRNPLVQNLTKFAVVWAGFEPESTTKRSGGLLWSLSPQKK